MKGTLTPDVARLWQQTRGNPITALVPLQLTAAINAFDQGYLRQLALIYDRLEMGADLDIATCAPKRREAIAGLPWEITVADEVEDSDQAEAERHQEALNHFFHHLQVRSAVDLDEDGEVRLLIDNLMQATFLRYDVHELLWQPRGADLTAELIHAPISLFECTRGGLAYAGPTGVVGSELLDREGWLVAKRKTLAIGLSVAWMFKSMCLKDWLEYNEGYGLPGVLGLTSAAINTTEWNDFASAINECVARFKILTGKDNELKILETAGQGGAAYQPLFELMQRAQITLCLGSDLSTLSRQDSQGASVQSTDTAARIASDARFVEDTINRRLVRRIIANVFGEDTLPLAWFRLRVPMDRDDALEMKKDEFLISQGVPVSVVQLAEKYGHALPVQVGADELVGKKAEGLGLEAGGKKPESGKAEAESGKAEGLGLEAGGERDADAAAVGMDNAFNPAQLRDRQGRWTAGYGVPTATEQAALKPEFEEFAAFYAEPAEGQEEAVISVTAEQFSDFTALAADRQREQNLVDTFSADNVETWPLPREQRAMAQSLESQLLLDHHLDLGDRAIATQVLGTSAGEQQRQQLVQLRKLAVARRNEARKNVKAITREINKRLADIGTDIEADDLETFFQDAGFLKAATRLHKPIDAFDGAPVANNAKPDTQASKPETFTTVHDAVMADLQPVLSRLKQALKDDDLSLLEGLDEAALVKRVLEGQTTEQALLGLLGETFAEGVGLPGLVAEVLAERQEGEGNDQ